MGMTIRSVLQDFVRYHTDAEWKEAQERHAERVTDGNASFLEALIANAEGVLEMDAQACQHALPLLEHCLKFFRYQRTGREFWPNREEAEAVVNELRAITRKEGRGRDTQGDMKERPVIELEECGCCEMYHRKDFDGDCRDDTERFFNPFLCDCLVCRNSNEDYLRMNGSSAKCSYGPILGLWG